MRRALSRSLARFLETAGLPGVRLHDLRHTVVSLLMELGVPPHVVQAIARHADVEVTLKGAPMFCQAGRGGFRVTVRYPAASGRRDVSPRPATRSSSSACHWPGPTRETSTA
ncbi:tyrosine-type recombinase/integrase [Micromonospora sp. NPDC049751]|uniref:tyrosine-type recombinase/integrase n=1 Tax=Micromonospora sp. NPDC049751 TaxID=3154837 RepID=UPI0033C5A495